MSKRLGNAIDPFTTIARFGADATRWYMVTNAPPWDNLKFNLEGVEEVQRKFFGTLYNTYSFFALYANIDKYVFDAENRLNQNELTELDRWILSRMNSLIKKVRSAMEDYDPTTAGRLIEEFVCDDLSNWYVRLGRKRFWRGDMSADKQAAYETLYSCLNTISQLMSPLSPFFADWLYRSLNAPRLGSMAESVHLGDLCEANEKEINAELELTMSMAQQLTSLVLSLRKKERIRVRQPLQKVMIPVLDEAAGKRLKHIEQLFLAEVNVKEIEYLGADNNLIVKKVKPNFKTLGPKLGADMKSLAKAVTEMTQQDIRTLEQQGLVGLNLGGRQFELELADVEILTQDMPGWLVASEGSLTVALDIGITHELKLEGLAREMVNRIQNMRKDSGLDVTDRIVVHFNADELIQESVTLYMHYICSETLADKIALKTDISGEETDIEGAKTIIQLTKA
jgi:isoleucyl-tRNA synthetase